MAENELIQAPENMELNLDDGTQVAGLLKGASKAILESAKKARKTKLEDQKNNPDAIIQSPMQKTKDDELKIKEVKPGVNVIPASTETTTENVQEAIKQRIDEGNVSGKPGGTPKQEFNFDVISEGNLGIENENINGIIGGFVDHFNIKSQKISNAQIKEQAQVSGIDEKFINDVIAQDPKLSGNAVEVYKAMQLLEASAKEIDVLMKKVADGNATDMEQLQLRQQMTLHGLISKGVKGIQTNTARALAIMRVPRDASNVDAIRRTLEETGGANSLQSLADHYITLNNQAAKNKMLDKTVTSHLVDIWLGTWINGLLSGPATHAKNILSATLFGAYQTPERLLAAVYGKVLPKGMRSQFSKTPIIKVDETSTLYNPNSFEETIEFEEFVGDFFALKDAVLFGGRQSAKTFKSGNAPTINTKLELMGNPNIGDNIKSLADRFGLDTSEKTFLAKGIDLYSTVVQVPGRALLTEDEFFRSTYYKLALNRLSIREGKKAYRNALARGLSDEDAIKIMDETVQDIFNDPPDEVNKAATDEAEYTIFVNKVPGIFGKMENIFRNPIVKTIVPFFRVPTNIGLATIERTPFAPLTSRFRDDFKYGGARRDLALAKMSLGTLAIVTLASYSAEGKLTGRGPTRKANQEALKRMGWQPYSIVYDYDATDKSNSNAIKKLIDKGFAVSIGKGDLKGKVYISYAGLEPVGAMIAMASDYAEYAKWHDTSSAFTVNVAGVDYDIESMFLGAGYGVYQYMSEQPMLQGWKDISDVISGDKYETLQDRINGLIKQFGSVAIGGSPAGALNSLIASIERYTDPTIKNTKQTGKDLPLGIKGWYEAYANYRNRIPWFNDDLPPRLNLWGQEEMAGNGWFTEILLPTRVSKENYSYVDDYFAALSSPINMPSPRIQGVELTANQYHDYIKLYNAIEINGMNPRAFFGYTITQPFFQALNYDQKQNHLSTIHNQFLEQARMKMVGNDNNPGLYPDLLEKINKLNNEKAIKGRFLNQF